MADNRLTRPGAESRGRVHDHGARARFVAQLRRWVVTGGEQAAGAWPLLLIAIGF
jgi:hypothetical protein